MPPATFPPAKCVPPRMVSSPAACGWYMWWASHMTARKLSAQVSSEGATAPQQGEARGARCGSLSPTAEAWRVGCRRGTRCT
eukprot:scaffold18678_cov128-Isochrysis_galbana.AAC.8